MTKYKELPECKSIEEFEIEDFVRYYYYNHDDPSPEAHSFDGKIDDIEDGLIWCEQVKLLVHWKSCRKLEEVKPRAYGLCVTHLCAHPNLSMRRCSNLIGKCKIIQVQEVTEEEEK